MRQPDKREDSYIDNTLKKKTNDRNIILTPSRAYQNIILMQENVKVKVRKHLSISHLDMGISEIIKMEKEIINL